MRLILALRRFPKAAALLTALFCLLLSPRPGHATEKLGVAVPYLPSKLSLANFEEPITNILLTNIAYGATRLGKASAVELEAATAIESYHQGRIWVVGLRGDLRFANQNRIHAVHALRSYEILSRYDQVRTDASAPYLVSLSQSDSAGQNIKLRFELPEPDPAFPRRLAQLPLLHPELFASFDESFGEGTNVGFLAPYQIRRHTSANLLLEAVPEFYRPGLPRARLVEFRVYGSAADALSALRVGAVDLIALPTERILQSAKEDETLAIIPSPLRNSAPVPHGWLPLRENWDTINSHTEDRLIMESIVIRKTLSVDDSLLARFDLTGTFLP